jgi:hypothetical protein
MLFSPRAVSIYLNNVDVCPVILGLQAYPFYVHCYSYIVFLGNFSEKKKKKCLKVKLKCKLRQV